MSSTASSKPFPDSPVPESPQPQRAAAFSTTVAAANFYPVVYRPAMSTSYSRSSPFLFRLLSAIVAASILVLIFSLILYLALRPRLPVVRVDSVTVSHLNNTSPTQFNADFDVTLVFVNPNQKLTVLLREIDLIVRYGGQSEERATLDTVRLAPFSMGTESDRWVRMMFSVVNEYMDSDVVKRISDEHARGKVNFQVDVSAVMRFKIGIVHSRSRSWDAECYPVVVSFTPNNGTGNLLGPMDWCVV